MGKKALVFGGQGSQFRGMGKKIYEKYPKVRRIYELASDVAGYNVAQMCFEGEQDTLNRTEYCQMCILAVEMSMYTILSEIDIHTDAVAGFSLGEYAALAAAQAISFKTVFELVNVRGQLMEYEVDSNCGSMIAVINMDAKIVEKLCEEIGKENAAIANYNSYTQVVVSVSKDCVEEFKLLVKKLGGRTIVLRVNKPFHHMMMLPAANKFRDYVNNCVFKVPHLPVYLNTSGDTLSYSRALYQELYEHIYKPVQWTRTVENMILSGVDTFYEISPKPVLSKLIQEVVRHNANVINVENILI